MSQDRFGEEEAQEILKLAARQSGAAGDVSRQDLHAMGAELGLSEEQIDAAIRSRREHRQLIEDRREFRRHLRSKAWGQMSSGLSFAVLLFGINFLTTSNKLEFGSYWAIWPVGFVALFSLVGFLESWRPKDREAEFRRWREKRRRREEPPIQEQSPPVLPTSEAEAPLQTEVRG